MIFTIDTNTPAQAPTKGFNEELVSSVRKSLESIALSNADASALCEYLDCLEAQLPGLSPALRTAATAQLRAILQQAPQVAVAAWAARSPAAKALAAKLARGKVKMPQLQLVAVSPAENQAVFANPSRVRTSWGKSCLPVALAS